MLSGTCRGGLKTWGNASNSSARVVRTVVDMRGTCRERPGGGRRNRPDEDTDTGGTSPWSSTTSRIDVPSPAHNPSRAMGYMREGRHLLYGTVADAAAAATRSPSATFAYPEDEIPGSHLTHWAACPRSGTRSTGCRRPARARLRARVMPLPLTMPRTLGWRAVGDPERIEALLADIVVIGRIRSAGHGEVLGWTVTADPGADELGGASTSGRRPRPLHPTAMPAGPRWHRHWWQRRIEGRRYLGLGVSCSFPPRHVHRDRHPPLRGGDTGLDHTTRR